jgi:hypothetical protein
VRRRWAVTPRTDKVAQRKAVDSLAADGAPVGEDADILHELVGVASELMQRDSECAALGLGWKQPSPSAGFSPRSARSRASVASCRFKHFPGKQPRALRGRWAADRRSTNETAALGAARALSTSVSQRDDLRSSDESTCGISPAVAPGVTTRIDVPARKLASAASPICHAHSPSLRCAASCCASATRACSVVTCASFCTQGKNASCAKFGNGACVARSGRAAPR